MKWLVRITTDNDCVVTVRGIEYGFDVECIECVLADGDVDEQRLKLVEFLTNDVVVQPRGYHNSMSSAIRDTIEHFNYSVVEDMSWFVGGNRNVEVLPYIEPILI